MKKKITLPILIVLLAGILFGLAYYAASNYRHASDLDRRMTQYIANGQWNEEEAVADFAKDSAEELFVKGIACFAEGRMEEAERYFRDAQESPRKTDVTLPVYLAIYQNICMHDMTGKTDAAAVGEALDKLARCPEVSNPAHWVWKLIYPFMEKESTQYTAVELMQQYLDKAHELTKEQRLQLKSYYAILKNIAGDYSESIMLFYDVLEKTQDVPESFLIVKTQSICINYIAEMYYSYEDYEKAKKLYLWLMDKTLEDAYEDAQMKYMAYINMADIYLQQKEYDRAREMIAKTELLLPYFDEATATEIEAFLYDILADIELAQGNLEKAKEHYKKCEAFLENNESTVFFDTEAYFKLTESNIMQKSGDLKSAERILKELLAKDIIVERKVIGEVRRRLAEIYRSSGQNVKYYNEQIRLLQVQNAQIKQYQSDYCEAIAYYEQLINLRKEHEASTHQNTVLAGGLIAAVVLLILILHITVGRYRESITDTLSGLYNRKQLEKEIAYYETNNCKFMSYGVIMTDIDYFKRYNDTYGHAAGDEVIRRVSNVLKQSVRKRDVVIRYGGEEFLILLKDVNHSTVESIAERIRVSVQEEKIVHEASECSDYVSVSQGSFFVEHTASVPLKEAIREADHALYESKRNGRNRVTVK